MTSTQLIRQIENDIMINIAKALKGGKAEIIDWQIEKLAGLGRLNRANLETVLGYQKELISTTESEIRAQMLAAVDKLDTAFKVGVSTSEIIPLSASPAIRGILEAAENSTAGTLRRMGETMISGAAETYTETVTKATTKVLAGVSSKNEAVTQAISEWSKNGLPGLVDKAGRTWQPDTYLNMRVRTEIRSATTELTFSRMDQYSVDLIEISSHVGSRPLCAADQGTIYSKSGKDKKYPAFSTTSYGEPAGLFGINCGHNGYPYFEGVSRQTYNPYKEKENAEVYKQSQRQRAIERTIRESKREVANIEAYGGETANALLTLKAREARMSEFISNTGRTRYKSLNESI